MCDSVMCGWYMSICFLLYLQQNLAFPSCLFLCPPYSLQRCLTLSFLIILSLFLLHSLLFPACLQPSLPLLLESLYSTVHHSIHPPHFSPATHASCLSPWHFRGNLIWVCLAFPRIPFSCQLSLPPNTKTNRGRPAKSSKHRWCWPHYLVFAFQITPTPLHFCLFPSARVLR